MGKTDSRANTGSSRQKRMNAPRYRRMARASRSPARGTLLRRLVPRGHALHGFGEPLPKARLVRASRSPARGTLPRRLVPRGHAPAAARPARSRAIWFRGTSTRGAARPRQPKPRAGYTAAATCPARSRARGDLSRAVTRYMVSGASILRMERTFSRTVLAATQRESRACISASSSPNTLQAV